MIKNETISLISVPIFTGLIGYVTNWTGVWMLFNPVHFKGFRMPGLLRVVKVLPRRIQQIPGVMQGGVGWQGIIPSRAAKMGSICVDKGISKIGGPGEFYDQLQPDKLAEHILESSRTDIRETVERILQRVHSYLNNLYRLGLIWFSREELEDLSRYQVLEAQPDVGDAMEEAGRGAKTVRRSIHLTPFGEDFCGVCLPAPTG